jgi:hypothetical protein
MKQKTVGTYSDGIDQYLLVICEGDDAAGFSRAENCNTGLIKIGADLSYDYELYDSLLHEIQELIYHTKGLRVRPTNLQVTWGGRLYFVFDHADYCEICARVGKFMVDAWPDLLKAWKQWRKK